MKIYDISMNVNKGMPVYKNKPEKKPELTVTSDFPNDSVHESRISMDMHTGTHFDAPLHMIQGGDTIDHFDLTKAVSKCKVLDLTNVDDKITAEDLKNKDIESGEFVLLKTKNSYDDSFNFNFVFLDSSGAEYLKEKNVIGVGTDGLGIERAQPNHETHKTLLANGITIIEGLRLKDVDEGEYTLIAAPLKIDGAEAAPARALLLEEDKKMKLNMYNVGNCIIGNSEVDIDDVHEILSLLIEKYGEDTMIEFIKNHENGQNLSDAFKNALSNKNMITKLKVKKIF